METTQRSVIRRIGLCLLNVLASGLGLFALGRPRAGIFYLLANFTFNALPILTIWVWPEPDPHVFLGIVCLTVMLVLICLGGSIVATWRDSRRVSKASGWSARWYGLVLILVVAWAVTAGIRVWSKTQLRAFYAVSESMWPTFQINDSIWASFKIVRPPRIGEIVFTDMGKEVRIYRVAALGGQRIAMRGGVPIIDGVLAKQREDGAIKPSVPDYPDGLHRYIEQLPGERGSHVIVDMGYGIGDDMPERIVPAEHVFLLGDNRDRSADSRYTAEQLGVGMVREADIVGRPIMIFWSRDHSRIGTVPR